MLETSPFVPSTFAVGVRCVRASRRGSNTSFYAPRMLPPSICASAIASFLLTADLGSRLVLDLPKWV